MRLLQAREDAIKTTIGTNEKITFELIGPEERRVKCTWLDTAKGTFVIDGENGFHSVDDFYQKNMQVQNMQIIEEVD